ncbi:MAG: hypothetical protein KAG86_05420, partial [Gammaproteobacteria bacterium]|nr:hypothetical protein [Gammaproteobacteria bacterium]
ARDADRSTLGATVKFDMFGNNQPIDMEWFAGDGDGILIDNRDGLAATQMNGKRLFGDQGGQFANGYEQLALFDTNADGQLTGAELSGLSLWLDNGDAIVQTGELQSLASHQIASISTKMAMFNGLMRSVATTTTGQSIMTEDVWFGFVPVPVAAPMLSPATQVSLSKLGLFSGILALLGLMGWQLRKRKNALMSNAVK